MATEYLNNKVFESIIVRFNEAKKNLDSKERKKKKKLLAIDKKEFQDAETDLTDAFYLLASNIIRAFKFQLVESDDALQEGVMLCFEKLHRFDPAKGKAFNFWSTILLNAMRQMYRTAKNYNELKMKYHDFLSVKNEEIFIQTLKSRKKKAVQKRNDD